MKVIWYMVCICAVIWVVGELYMDKSKSAYRRGYQDGLSARKAPPVDKQCVSWLMQTNLKDAKQRICK